MAVVSRPGSSSCGGIDWKYTSSDRSRPMSWTDCSKVFTRFLAMRSIGVRSGAGDAAEGSPNLLVRVVT